MGRDDGRPPVDHFAALVALGAGTLFLVGCLVAWLWGAK